MKYLIFAFIPESEGPRLMPWANFVAEQISRMCDLRHNNCMVAAAKSSEEGEPELMHAEDFANALHLPNQILSFDSVTAIRYLISRFRETDVLIFFSRRGDRSVGELLKAVSTAAICYGHFEHGEHWSNIIEKAGNPENHAVVIPTKSLRDAEIKFLPAPQTAMSRR